jgi:hypothetical protein
MLLLYITEREIDVIKGLAEFLKTYNLSNKQAGKYIHYTDSSVSIQIVNFSDIINVIIPLFNQYEIQGQKNFDFYDFKKVK